MAFPTSVNDQITDSVTQTNTTSIEGSAHELLGEVIRALGVASQKGITDQHQAEIVSHAASIVGIKSLIK